MDAKIKICCDLDDVVFDFLGSFIPFMQQHARTPAPEKLEGGASKWTSWDGYEEFGITREEFLRLLTEFSDRGGLRAMKVVSLAGKYLQHLADEHYVTFVTRRPPKYISQTIGAFEDDLRVDFDSIYHVGEDVTTQYQNGVYILDTTIRDKTAVFLKEKPLIVIDDHPEYIEQAIRAAVPHVILVAKTHNYRWRKKNQEFIEHAGIVVVKHNWIHIYTLIIDLISKEKSWIK